MDGIIQDLLALSRIVPDGPTALCDLAEATEQLRDEPTTRADQSSVSLTIDVQAATVHCSEGLLRQVVWSLADNAMKYRCSDVPPHVEICGRACGQTYELAVRDNGIGISHEEAKKVFEPFFRASAGRREPGSAPSSWRSCRSREVGEQGGVRFWDSASASEVREIRVT